jgi:hypothetical protein
MSRAKINIAWMDDAIMDNSHESQDNYFAPGDAFSSGYTVSRRQPDDAAVVETEAPAETAAHVAA